MIQEQATSTILMIRPVRFGFNIETANSNAFQDVQAAQNTNAQIEALAEFDGMVSQLRAAGVDVIVIEDTLEPHTPDSIFPNNWVSFHHSGKVILYPMEAQNRRLERRTDIIEQLSHDFHIEEIIDLTASETNQQYLEGTGSMVLDRMNRIAYACISSRTNEAVLATWQSYMSGYELVCFGAFDQNGKAIYHTNVLMCVGDTFAVVCLEALTDLDERLMLKEKLEKSGKIIIEISLDQMNHFAGNMLLVKKKTGAKLLVMSSQAYRSLTESQIRILGSFTEILHSDLSTIEANGGGSARCMMAEVHLPKK
jgi:hypothetical protein